MIFLKNLDLFDQQTTLRTSLRTLFVIFTFCGLKLRVKSLHPKQYVVPSYFPVIFHSLQFGKMFLTIHFKRFDFIEWFDLNSNSSNLFERSSISDFLVDNFGLFFS